jgi:hypothetical protein
MSSTVLYMSMSSTDSSPGPTKDRTMVSATEATGCTSGPFQARRVATLMQPLRGCEA